MVKAIELVKTFDEICENIQTIDKYLNDPDLKEYAFGLIKRGICFVVVKIKCEYRFYPSRFLGYNANTKNLHYKNLGKDGEKTNKAISKIIGKEPLISEELDEEYCRFCERLGITPNLKGAFGFKRKFWPV